MWHEQLREPSLSGIRYHSRAGRTLFSTPPCPGLVMSPWWPLCCSKQDKSKTGLWAKLSSLPAPGSVLYIYCLGAEKAAGCAQDRNSGWDFSTHLSFHGRQRGDPRNFFVPCSPLTGRRKKGSRWRGPLERPFVLNIQRQVLVTGSQVPQPTPKLRTPCISLYPARLSHPPGSLGSAAPSVLPSWCGPCRSQEVTCGTRALILPDLGASSCQ